MRLPYSSRIGQNATPVAWAPPAAEAADTKKVTAGDHFHFATIGPVTSDGVTIPAGTVEVACRVEIDRR